MTRILRVALLGLFATATLAAATGAPALAARSDSPTEGADTLARFLRGNRPVPRPYRARRTLEASTMGGRMKATVEAWTSVDASGRFHYDVILEDGSALIREHVLLKALETERRNHEPGERGRAALTASNYVFTPAGPTADGLVTIELRPHRPDPMLLNGVLTLRPGSGEIDALTGSLSDTPSWWTRHVDIGQRYAVINGANLPVELWSRADVRVAGDSHFRMRYVYQQVDGRPVQPD